MAEIYKSMPVTGSRRLGADPYSQHESRGSARDAENTSKPIQEKRNPSPGPNHYRDNASVESEQYIATATEANLVNDLLEQVRKESRVLAEENARLERELSEYRANKARAEEESRKKGFDQGYREGAREAEAEYQSRTKALVSAIAAFDKRLADDREMLLTSAARLGFEALVRIIGEHYRDPDFIAAMVEAAISKIGEKRNVIVHLAPEDFETVQRALAEGQIRHIEHCKFMTDPRVKTGGCIIDTENGSWDARLDTQLDRIKEALVLAHKGR